jgi:diacylglycerol kinase family enzyme
VKIRTSKRDVQHKPPAFAMTAPSDHPRLGHRPLATAGSGPQVVGRPAARRRVLMIINPSASGVTARNRVVIQNALSAEHDLEVSETHRRGHATRFAQAGAARGVDVVVSVGGDGTVNEVANGLAGTQTALAVLPGGSTNVFARQLGFTNDPEQAAEEILAGIRSSTHVRIGLGKVNGRYFCFHVGMGFDAAVVERVERFGTLKRWLGHPLFGYAAVTTWSRGADRRRAPFTVELADEGSFRSGYSTGAAPQLNVSATPGFFAVVLNIDPYTFLGSRPLSLAPAATITSPLSVVNVQTLRLDRLLRAAAAAVRGRGMDGLSFVQRVEGLFGLTVRGNRPFPWQVDGDHLGDTDLLEFSWEPDALTIIRPGFSAVQLRG